MSGWNIGFRRRRWRRHAPKVLAGVCWALAAGAQAFDHTHAQFDALLKAHVDEQGLVDYRALKAKPDDLKAYLDTLAAVSAEDYETWTPPQRLAFAFNLYNASTLQLIVDHYPIKSIRDIGTRFRGPWKQPAVRFRGSTITLDALEHGYLRKEYNEPRLHLALVCAAKGCPPLRREAYVAERLDAQLDDQSRKYLGSSRGLQLDRANGEARISAIFQWYGKDFPSVAAFVAKHSGESLDGLKIRYLDYDWSLNEQ